MGAKLWNSDPSVSLQKITYDFAVHGGAVGTIALGNLPDSFVVTGAYVVCETALVGGGTFVVGEDGGGDADGYFLDLDGIALSAVKKGDGALLMTAPATANEIGDDKAHIVVSTKDGVLVTIGTTAYTAGKLHFFFEGFQGL